MSSLVLRYLAYFGQEDKEASLEFKPGLNVICGASDTGKSFLAESIDFMFGQQGPIRDIPERADFDRVQVVLESSDETPLTLERSVEGGNFHAYDKAIYERIEEEKEPRILKWKHSPKHDDTLSHELLSRIKCVNKILRVNAEGKTRTLSFRDLARLCVVTEEEIQTRNSPVLTGQYTNATSEYAVFKMLVTGNDDSALVSSNSSKGRQEQNKAKVELLDQMISELRSELDDDGAVRQELEEQEQKLNESIDAQSQTLQAVQTNLDGIVTKRSELAIKLNKYLSRVAEIAELENRFELLDEHYKSDLERLEAIYESGSLFVHLPPTPCPLCGSPPGNQHLNSDCEGNTDAVVTASKAEMKKVQRLRSELAETLASLRKEHIALQQDIPSIRARHTELESELSNITAPSLAQERSSYRVLMREVSEVKLSLQRFDNLNELVERRSKLKSNKVGSSNKSEDSKTQISKSKLDKFAQFIEQILHQWDYPDVSRVFFDTSKRDIEISGKERGSTGKGLRAITHAAFTIGLMRFARENGLPHPGFVVVDSPLLAYWKPEGKDDDLRGTDLKENFYRYLMDVCADDQIIVIENEPPPIFVSDKVPVTVFTKNPREGRYGFFPPC